MEMLKSETGLYHTRALFRYLKYREQGEGGRD